MSSCGRIMIRSFEHVKLLVTSSDLTRKLYTLLLSQLFARHVMTELMILKFTWLVIITMDGRDIRDIARRDLSNVCCPSILRPASRDVSS